MHVLFVILALLTQEANCERSFKIDYERDTFLKDGRPHRYVSGSMHYMRVPRDQWRDRMLKMRMAGVNALQTYVEWASHETSMNTTDFSGNLNLMEYLDLADEMGFDVILRPGPYIDAERDFGGLPYWLLKDPTIKLRSNSGSFMAAVTAWWKKLFFYLQPYLYKNGGPIIMIQVENEYGSYGQQTGHCDKTYLARLRDLLLELVGDNVLLFTTDGAGQDMVMCGKIPGVYATVDFGPGVNVTQAFGVQRLFEPRGPLVNSEFYPGWLDHWQAKHSKVKSSSVVKTLDEMLSMGANVNIYMFHGGTSFGLTAGANYPPFQATPTSYDYDAPISEAGDLTEKYWLIRETVGRYLPLPPLPPGFSNVTDKMHHGPIAMRMFSNLFESLNKIGRFYGRFEYPQTFEVLDQNQGLMLYETKVKKLFPNPSTLTVSGLADRGYIFIDHRPVGVLSREGKAFSLPIQIRPNQTLQIVVENQGRICFGAQLADRKGIVGNVSLSGHILTNWTITGLPFVEVEKIQTFADLHEGPTGVQQTVADSQTVMSWWSGVFTVSYNSVNSQPPSTFLRLDGFQKGIVMINRKLLGRYWPNTGPQVTLYVPGSFLSPHGVENKITLLEEDGVTCTKCYVQLVDTPEIDGPTPE